MKGLGARIAAAFAVPSAAFADGPCPVVVSLGALPAAVIHYDAEGLPMLGTRLRREDFALAHEWHLRRAGSQFSDDALAALNRRTLALLGTAQQEVEDRARRCGEILTADHSDEQGDE